MHPERFSELRYLGEEEVEKQQQWKDGILSAVSGTPPPPLCVCFSCGSLSLQAREIKCQQIPAAAEVAGAMPEETMDMTGESDLSSVSTLSKLSSNVSKLTDIDGQSWDMLHVVDTMPFCLCGPLCEYSRYKF